MFKIVSNCSATSGEQDGDYICYDRERLLDIQRKYWSALPNKDIILNFNNLRLCSQARKKPTHRGSKGYHRTHNTRQRQHRRINYLNLKPIARTPRTTPAQDQLKLPNLFLSNCQSLTSGINQMSSNLSVLRIK
jgi:hypothetical protein